MENKIKQYVADIVANPIQDVYKLSNIIFGENPLADTSDNFLVIPELGEIKNIKRGVIIDIVLKKTGYRLALSEDTFTPGSMTIIDKLKVGE